MSNQQKTVTRAPQMDPHHGGFQSAEAHKLANRAPEEPDDTPVQGEVSSDEAQVVAEVQTEDYARQVTVRSREYIAPFRYGNKMYTIPANKPTLVPLYVRRHLEEKGLI